MRTDDDKATAAYRELVADISPRLPMHALRENDVKLAVEELAVVIAHFGGKHFVSEALDDTDTFDILAVRVLVPDVGTAAMACGVRVLAAVNHYAASLLIRDVNAYRDRQKPVYTFTDECRDYGVPVQGAP